MKRHRRPPQRKVSARPTPDNRRAALPPPAPTSDLLPELDHLHDALRDDLRRADAFISVAERQIEENWHDDDGDDRSEGDVEEEFETVLRHRMRIEYLVEAGKLAVRAALYTAQRIDAVIAAHKRGE